MTKKEGFLKVEGGNVYYSIYGGGDKTPLLALHGGPGFSHDLLTKMAPLGDERPVIFYDQLGAGKSDRPKDPSLWNIERFVRELGQVREALKLDEFVLHGHSWGTMLGVDYMLTNPKGVEALILSSPCLSAARWKADTNRLLLGLPKEIQTTIAKHEAAGTTDSQEYQDAFMEFVKKHACRIEPLPSEVTEAFGKANMEVYTTMWGPSEWYPVGNLKDYDRVADLHKIKVPTLFTCGRFDEAVPDTVKHYQEQIPGSQMVVFEKSSHMAMWEEEKEYVAALRKFLTSYSRNKPSSGY